jgi:hypothetical protein
MTSFNTVSTAASFVKRQDLLSTGAFASRATPSQTAPGEQQQQQQQHPISRSQLMWQL